MAQWVSFDDLKIRVSIRDVLEHYGLLAHSKERTTSRGVELRLRCPFHEDKTPSFSVNVASGRFHCFGCNAKGGDIFDFVMCKEDIAAGDRTKDRRKAALLVQEWFGAESPQPAPKDAAAAPQAPAVAEVDRQAAGAQEGGEPAKKEIGEDANPPLKFTFKNLDYRHPYLVKERGLSEATIDAFGVGYHAGKGMMSGRIVIPIHNERGELVAYAGRWPGDHGWPEGEDKYKLPPGFHKSLVLFNLHKAREHASEGLIVVEGFFTVFEFWQKGRKNVVALMGSTMSEAQERLIVETVGLKGKVLMALDADEAGRKGSVEAVRRLASKVFVREIAL